MLDFANEFNPSATLWVSETPSAQRFPQPRGHFVLSPSLQQSFPLCRLIWGCSGELNVIIHDLESLLLLLQEDSGQVQVTELPQTRFQWGFPEQKQKGSHLPELFGNFQVTHLILTAFPRELHPWDNTKRSFHHHCNSQREEDELNKQNLGWKHFLRYFQIFTFRRWLRWQHRSLPWVNIWYKKAFNSVFSSGQRGIPRNFHKQICPKKIPQNCLISVTKVHEFVE